jgi:hypothetical protein
MMNSPFMMSSLRGPSSGNCSTNFADDLQASDHASLQKLILQEVFEPKALNMTGQESYLIQGMPQKDRIVFNQPKPPLSLHRA